MNTTTITIQWNDYDGYRDALRAVRMHPKNTFEHITDEFIVKAESNIERYTPERQLLVMQHFGCVSSKSPFGRRREPLRAARIRFLIWRYCNSKFDVTHAQLAKASDHIPSTVTNGLNRISRMIDNPEIQELRSEVYAKCDEIFR